MCSPGISILFVLLSLDSVSGRGSVVFCVDQIFLNSCLMCPSTVAVDGGRCFFLGSSLSETSVADATDPTIFRHSEF
jgi:hypothetical protein